MPRKQATLRTRSSLALLHIAGGFYKRDRRNTPAKLQLNYETGNFPARYLLFPLFFDPIDPTFPDQRIFPVG